MKSLVTIVCMSIPLAMSAQNADTDSIKSKELNEVVVEAKMQHTSATVSTYIPTSKQKNASQNGVDLLNRMAIPQLRLSPGLATSVQTTGGQDVDIFIDYLPASSEDIEGMRMTDVKRVEYLDYPSDPRFLGKAHVVNFIMQKYEYGGYVKANANAYLYSNSYNAGILAKLQYKRMTYDLAFGAKYYDSKHLYSNSTETFRLPVGEGTFREIVKETTTENARVRNKYLWPTFKALYQSENITLRNTLGTNFAFYPVKRSSGLVSYTYASDLAPESFSSDASSRNNSLTYSGDWNFIFNSSNSLNADLFYSYTFTTNSSYYNEETVKISNTAKDYTHNAAVNLIYFHSFGKAGNISALLRGGLIRNNTQYSGTADVKEITWLWNGYTGITYNYSNDKFNCSAKAAITWNKSKLGEVEEQRLSPTGYVSLQYSPTERHSLSFFAGYYIDNPGGQYRSSAVIQQNPLMSYTGNAFLTPQNSYNFSLSYTCLPSNKFNFGPYINFNSIGNRYAYFYEALPTGILKKIVQPAGGYSNLAVGAYGVCRLIDNRLTLAGQISYSHLYDGGQFDINKSYVSYSGQATYYLDNWNVGAYFVSGATTSGGSMSGTLITTKADYGLLAGWGNASWNLQAYITNFARWNWHDQNSTLHTPNYSAVTQSFSPNEHCFILLSATYTFGFGKKVQRGDEATQQTSTSSGILQ